jgi:hypothetical protein
MKKHFLLLPLITIIGVDRTIAQVVSIGAKGGVSLLDPTGPNDESRRYLVGPSVEIRLPAGFAIETDALYQRIGSSATYFLSLGASSTVLINRERGNSWEFPLLGKYYFRPSARGWRPFIASGYAFRTVGFHVDGSAIITDASGSHLNSFRDDFRSGPDVGAIAAAGVRFHAGGLAWSPEVRYTRWGGSSNLNRKNEAAILLGISF